MTEDLKQAADLIHAKADASRTRQWASQLSTFGVLFILLPLSAISCSLGENKEVETDPFQARVAALRTAQANAPTKAKPAGVKNDDAARNLLWSHLSLCISIETRALKAFKVKGDWFVQSSDSSSQDPGIWKVNGTTGALEPYDALARSWHSLVESQCSPEILATLTTPTPLPTPTLAVAKANDAVVQIWAYLLKCDPSLPVEQFQARWNTLSGRWVITSKSGTEVNYGVWTLRGDTGELLPNDRTSSQWHEYVWASCNPELKPAIGPRKPVVTSSNDAVNSVWSYLVRCFPNIQLKTLEAKWNPSAGEWVVITKVGAATDYGVWSVLGNGTVRAWNPEATSRKEVVEGDPC